MKLDIDSIRKGDKNTLNLDFALALDVVDFYGDKIYIVSPVDVKGKLHVIDCRLYITLEITTDMQANCNRCLEPFIYHFNSSINAEIIHENLFEHEEDDQVDDDIIYYKDNVVDLAELIKEHIIMNIPIKLVCDEACQGLCPRCGKRLENGSCDCDHVKFHDDDIDPRLAKLKELL
ncbi:MAG: YceD family protein [Candidatus Alkaliphilus sp. MAG34]|nr:DUF177 domain-containing protein [Clostridiales bacterium]